MKYLLIITLFLTSCSIFPNKDNRFVGTWIRTYEDGRIELVNIYPDNKIITNVTQMMNWKTNDEQLIIIAANKEVASIAKLNTQGLLISEKIENESYWTNWVATRISRNPETKIDLYQVCNNSKNGRVWECSNVGQGGECRAYFPAPEITSLKLDTCQQQCQEILALRAKRWPKFKDEEKCLIQQ